MDCCTLPWGLAVMTHTPGPWRVGEDMRGTRRVFAGDSEIVRALSKHGFDRRLPENEREANRRLIAAAPDMLAALEHARHVMWEYGFSENDLQPIRAAIALAEQP